MRKITAMLLLLALALNLAAPTLAMSPVMQLAYSQEANSGSRHQVCTTLQGTSAFEYYTGDYEYPQLSAQAGAQLLETLRSLMTGTHTHYTTYSDCRDYAVKTDCETGDGVTINLLYTSYAVTMEDYINNATDGGGWNREHVWPVSLGSFSKNDTPGCDLHHIRPTDKSVNSKRDNEKYGIPTNGHSVHGTVTVENAVGGYSDNTYFEPLDNVKGDVARICLYMYVRYGSEYSGCASITNVFQSIDVLLSWHEADPVDTWEMGRNEVVCGIQGNRNVFIDFPELAWLLFDREVPANMQTPSMRECWGEHNYSEWRVETEATETTPGTKSRFCDKCQHKFTEEIPAWKDCTHQFGNWIGHEDGAGSTCNVCGYYQWVDNENPQDLHWVWIAVAVVGVAAAAMVVIVIVKKKR